MIPDTNNFRDDADMRQEEEEHREQDQDKAKGDLYMGNHDTGKDMNEQDLIGLAQPDVEENAADVGTAELANQNQDDSVDDSTDKS